MYGIEPFVLVKPFQGFWLHISQPRVRDFAATLGFGMQPLRGKAYRWCSPCSTTG